MQAVRSSKAQTHDRLTALQEQIRTLVQRREAKQSQLTNSESTMRCLDDNIVYKRTEQEIEVCAYIAVAVPRIRACR